MEEGERWKEVIFFPCALAVSSPRARMAWCPACLVGGEGVDDLAPGRQGGGG